MPSTIVIYISLAFVYIMPKLEKELEEKALLAKNAAEIDESKLANG